MQKWSIKLKKIIFALQIFTLILMEDVQDPSNPLRQTQMMELFPQTLMLEGRYGDMDM